MDVSNFLLLVFVVLAAAGSAALLIWSRRRLSQLEGEAAAMRERVKDLARMERDHRFVAGLLGELPLIAGRLFGRRSMREIPGVLIEAIEEVFQPQEALVLVRRRSSRAEPARDRQLIVAGASRSATSWMGRVVSLGEGELGRVAEVRSILTREDFERDPVEPSASDGLAEFRCELAAPLEVGDQLLGVVALSRPARVSSQNKPVLRLVAHLGAQALHSTRTLRQMKSVADLDPLTGVFNKRVLSFRLGEWVHRAESHNERLSVFLFDLDDFKKYNDRNGHPAGDELLISLARLVDEQIRSDDLFGRFGGEEFLLLMPDRSAGEAAAAAEKIRATIEGHDFPFGSGQPLGAVTVSGGVAVFPDHASGSSGLLRAADRALYEAKRAGRNCVRVASAERPREEARVAEPGAPPLVAEPDDLQAIQGVGASFAELLREAGLVSYQQLARLTWRDVIDLAERLRIAPERIVRDRWIDQARQLHFRTYGERLEDLE